MTDVTSSNSAKIIRGTLESCLTAMAQLDILKEEIKGNIDSLHEQFDLDKKTIKAVLKCLHDPEKSNINELESNVRKVREYYDAFGATTSTMSVTSETAEDGDDEGTPEDVEFDGELDD